MVMLFISKYTHEGFKMFYSPEERTKALYYFFGWQGGTVHQLAKETGLSVDQILHGDKPAVTVGLNSPYAYGFTCVRTCDFDHRRLNAKKYIGDIDYWSGVIYGYYVTGPLS